MQKEERAKDKVRRGRRTGERFLDVPPKRREKDERRPQKFLGEVKMYRTPNHLPEVKEF